MHKIHAHNSAENKKFALAIKYLVKSTQLITVWKFHNFSITQILREINVEDFSSAKLAILTHLEPLNFDFYRFLHFLKADIYQINKIHSP